MTKPLPNKTMRFQSSVRINVGPNQNMATIERLHGKFQSSVRINVGPNCVLITPASPISSVGFNPP